jgi:hypothetical protein
VQRETPNPDRQAAYWKSIQDENGVDLTLIRENLKLSPLERLRKCERAYLDMLRIRRYVPAITKDAS